MIPNVAIKVNSSTVAAKITAASKVLDAAGQVAGLQAAQRVRDTIRSHVTGRPGPEIDEGSYFRSWQIRHVGTVASGITSWSVFTDEEQAHRLEFGFVGSDSLGRNYDQAPFPHVQVSIDEASEGVLADFGRAFGGVL